MRLAVVAVGRLKKGPETDLAARYRGRAVALARSLGCVGPEIVDLAEGKGRRADERRAEEAAAIETRTAGSLAVVFDERAPSLASEAFANRLQGWRDSGQARLSFVIGGPDGLHERIRAASGLAVSFGQLTLPHGLVRVLVLEQLYRALTIMAGHPYHRGSGES